MREWLTIDVALGLLLVTSFTCVGLLSLWAATSPRHWFFRTVVVVAVLLPPLFIPADEVFVAFVLQALVVAMGVQAARWWRRERSEKRTDSWFQTIVMFELPNVRFSLTWLMLMTVLIAGAAAIAARLPELNAGAWGSVTLIGTSSGLATLIGAWLFASPRKVFAWPIGLVLCLLLDALLGWKDWFVPSIVGWTGWPPNSTGALSPIGLGTIERPILVWLVVVPLVALIVTLLLFFFHAAFRSPVRVDEARWRPRRWVARCLFILAIALLGVFPLMVLATLMTPSPMPAVTLPDPNGYDDLVAAGKMFNSQILSTAVEPKSTDELAAEVAKFAPAFERIRLGLSRPCQVPLWPPLGKPLDPLSTVLPDIQDSRQVARSLMREAELAQQQRRFRNAALSSLDGIRVGQAITRGGLLIHVLVGLACEGIGDHTLYPSIAHLDAATCREMIAAMQEIDTQRESLNEVWYRDRIWDEHAYGWPGHLTILLQDLEGSYGSTNWQVRTETLPRKQAITRMLIVELALRAYQLEHDSLPQDLGALVPAVLDELPLDPFDPNGGPLKYVRTADGYLLYSLGHNSVDDGGAAPAADDFPGMPQTGDLRLDVFLAPDEETGSDAEEDAESDGSDGDNDGT